MSSLIVDFAPAVVQAAGARTLEAPDADAEGEVHSYGVADETRF